MALAMGRRAQWQIVPLASGMPGQARHNIVVPTRRLTKRTSRSSGPGGQSVNMSDTRVQLSFQLDLADWIPADVRAKMFQLHKNRISKTNELMVACQNTSSQIENNRIAITMIDDLIAQAQKAVLDDQWETNEKKDYTEWVIEKKKRDGREIEIEKRAEAIKDQKNRSRERTKSKKITMY